MEHKRKHESLVNRLRAPIDPNRSVIHMDNDISNLGLRMLVDKVDAIAEAVAYLLDRKHAKIKKAKLRKQISLTDGQALELYRKQKKRNKRSK